MARPRSKTPGSIEMRNFKKRHGAFQVWITEDLKWVAFESNRKPNVFSKIVMETLGKLGAEVTTSGSGKSTIAWFPLREKPEAVAAALKLAAVPEQCERCEGQGEIVNPASKPVDPPKGLQETWREYNERIYAERVAAGLPTSWTGKVTCPACLGSGRAAQLETEAGIES